MAPASIASSTSGRAPTRSRSRSSGFSSVRREGIELAGSFTAIVNADLKIGTVQETITVTGETPIVDVQSVTKQRVINQEIIEAIPTGRNQYNLGVLIPGVTHEQPESAGRRRQRRARRRLRHCRPWQPAGLAADHAERHHARDDSRPAATAAAPCPTRRRCRSGRSTTRVCRPSWPRAACGSTSFRRRAATRSGASCSAASRTTRCRGATSRRT